MTNTAKKNNLTARSAGFFPVNNPPAEFSSVKGFAAELLELKAGEISRVLSAKNGYYLVQMTEKKSSYLPPLKEIENEVRKHFVFFERNRLAAQEARLILDRIKAGEPLEKIAREKGLLVAETGFFRPGESIPKLGPNQGDADTMYQLSSASPYPENPLFINNSYVVFKLKDLSEVDIKDFAAKKDVYERMLLTIKQEEAMRSWLAGNKDALIREKRIDIKKQAQDL